MHAIFPERSVNTKRSALVISHCDPCARQPLHPSTQSWNDICSPDGHLKPLLVESKVAMISFLAISTSASVRAITQIRAIKSLSFLTLEINALDFLYQQQEATLLTRTCIPV